MVLSGLTCLGVLGMIRAHMHNVAEADTIDSTRQ